MVVITKCDMCIHKLKDLKDGWRMCCKAFPDGIPSDYIFKKDVEQLDECNNGIKFERDPEWEGW